MGSSEGCGWAEGSAVGWTLGSVEGCALGCVDGAAVGVTVGATVGSAEGSVVGVGVGVTAPPFTVSIRLIVEALPDSSVAVRTSSRVPLHVGVPEMVPLAKSSERPEAVTPSS